MSTNTTQPLDFCDSDGTKRTLDDCNMHVDNAGRFWLWSNQLNINLAVRAKTQDDALLSAIDTLLHAVQLRDDRIAKLQAQVDLAKKFADQLQTLDNDD